MSIKFTTTEIEKIQEGNYTNVADKLRRSLEEGQAINFSQVQKLMLKNKDNFERYKYELKKKFPNNAKVQFAIDQAEVSKIADTMIEVAGDALLRDNSLLARLNIREINNEVSYIELREFDEERDAETLAATAAGTLIDDRIRRGDTLLPKTSGNASKIQASFQMEELSSFFLGNVTALDYQERLINRVKNRIIDRVLYAGNGVANNTARQPGMIRGVLNNYGVNGTGDDTNFIGAIAYNTFAQVNTATNKTGVNEYEQALYVKALTLSSKVSDVEEQDYVFVMNRRTWGRIRTAKDLNGRFLVQSGIDAYTNKPVEMLDGTPVILHTAVADNFVFLMPPRYYTLAMVGGIKSLNDGGIVQLREGITTYVARAFVDGSMNYGFKYKSTTTATIGTTAIDNQQQNAFRYFTVALS
jgi:uncharacterized membrane-anchored protein YhcB (DUF1043 family)